MKFNIVVQLLKKKPLTGARKHRLDVFADVLEYKLQKNLKNTYVTLQSIKEAREIINTTKKNFKPPLQKVEVQCDLENNKDFSTNVLQVLITDNLYFTNLNIH